MANHIQHLFIINRAGSLIYSWEARIETPEVEKTYEWPIDVHLEEVDQKAVVVFGEKEGVKLRYYVKSVNGEAVTGTRLQQGAQQVNVLEFLQEEDNYPVTVRFAAPTVSTNEKIILSSMFHSLFTIAVQLSPCPKSSGVEVLETTQFKLFCLQSRTGVKFVVITSAASNIAADSLLSKMYELYTDFALKNPFYSIDMPIRAQKFDEAIKILLEKAEKSNGAVTF
ncbi:hypothetical protein CRE_27921 [Caenorhabditis remanei]|uniref:Trafficking protein particle complex subunit n=1 Tax=Caenorhabditis remanei TaxID=31234 RepID=E3NLG7_CAERE|nr:hypothetical protein CRE_27921 [Caenorhabditis remanei]